MFLILMMPGAWASSGKPVGALQPAAINWPQPVLHAVASGINAPVHITHAGDGSGRVFIIEQAGVIRILKNGALQAAPFLDIRDRVRFSGEQGLLSLAFPPGYLNKGHFYVYYTQSDGNNRVARFRVTADPDSADPTSEQLVLALNHPTYGNHNGGQLAFGPDGFLYVGTGDGGGAGDPSGNAQNPAALQGKLLRLDVESGAGSYSLPASNPYISTPGYRGEIWALGLRNPWRFAFDPVTGDLYIGDVGQDLVEEIDFQPVTSGGGENYGWNILEGTLCYQPASGCQPPARYSPPIWTYEHGPSDSTGCAVTGGVVYRGARYPRMDGIYFYSDYCTGRLWGLQSSGGWQNIEFFQTGFNVTTFGQDQLGEIYLADSAGGKVYHITDPRGVAGNLIYLPGLSK